MNSREAFEVWCCLEWKNPVLTGDIYTLMPSGIEKWVYDDNEVHSAWTGWQASRKQLMKELSEKEPDLVVHETDSSREKVTSYIIRPTEEE